MQLCKSELAQSLSRGLIFPPSFAQPLTVPPRDSPALTTHSITPPGQGLPARQAAGDALGNEGVPVLLVSAVLHGILPHTCPIHGCRTETQVGMGWPPRPFLGLGPLAGTSWLNLSPLWSQACVRAHSQICFSTCVCVLWQSQGTHREPTLAWRWPRAGSGDPCTCHWELRHWGLLLSANTRNTTLCVIPALSLGCSGVKVKPRLLYKTSEQKEENVPRRLWAPV